ncbi:MAG: hypothetical protein V1893_01550 [Candidatus Omnitrophota bacterium]
MKHKHALLLSNVMAILLISITAVYAQQASSGAGDFSILVDDFNAGKTFNLLNGKTQGDEELLGGCVPSFTTAAMLTKGLTGHSLRLDFDVTTPGSFSYYYSLLGAQRTGSNAMDTLDVSKYDYLSFYVRSTLKDVNFKIMLYKDKDNDGLLLLNNDLASAVFLAKYYDYWPERIGTWQKVVIPFSDFDKIQDFSNILELVITFESRSVDNQGTVFIDDILFGKGLKEAQAVNTMLPLQGSYAGTIKNYNVVLKENDTLIDENVLSIEAPTRAQEPRLESVRFEYSTDSGATWYTIGSDYDLSDNVYSVKWNTNGLAEGLVYDLMVTTCGILGEEMSAEVLKNLHIKYSQ